MTNTAILSCLVVASKGSSLKSMFEQATAHDQTLSYDSLTRFFSRPWSAENELQEAAQNLFQLREGWAILDEIVIAKSIESTLLASVKRRRKSAGGYVTPAISVVLLLWSDGRQRVPLAFEYRNGPESVQELGLRLLRRLRNQFKLRPRCVLFDAGFFSYAFVKRLHSYGWAFVCRAPRSITFEDKRLWQFKRQGFWNDVGQLKNGLKVRAVRRAGKFWLCNRVTWLADTILAWYGKRASIEEVFRVLKQCCHWGYCQLRSETAYIRYLATGFLSFMTWKTARLKASEPTTLYKLRSTVMFGDDDPPIPDYFTNRQIA